MTHERQKIILTQFLVNIIIDWILLMGGLKRVETGENECGWVENVSVRLKRVETGENECGWIEKWAVGLKMRQLG